MAKRLVDTSSSDKLALESDFQECVKLNSNTEQDISSDIQVNGWLKVGNLSVVGGSSGSQGYAFYEVEPKTVEGYREKRKAELTHSQHCQRSKYGR